MSGSDFDVPPIGPAPTTGVVEHTEDGERWQRYLRTGRSIPLETVRARLETLADQATRRQRGS